MTIITVKEYLDGRKSAKKHHDDWLLNEPRG